MKTKSRRIGVKGGEVEERDPPSLHVSSLPLPWEGQGRHMKGRRDGDGRNPRHGVPPGDHGTTGRFRSHRAITEPPG